MCCAKRFPQRGPAAAGSIAWKKSKKVFHSVEKSRPFFHTVENVESDGGRGR